MILKAVMRWPFLNWTGVLRKAAGRGQTRGAVFAACESLDMLVAAVSETVSSTERDFVVLGQELRGLYSRANELTGVVRERAVALREALQATRWADADGLAQGVILDVRRSMEEAAGLLRSLQEVGQTLSELDARAHAVQRIGVYLRSSVVGFAIESSRSVECQHSFKSFVTELRGLSESVGKVVEDVTGEVRTARESQQRSFKKLAQALREIRQVSVELESAARTTAMEARSMLERSLEALRQAEQRAGAITRHADASVYHLQFGDIVRQRTEHVLEALAGARELLGKAERGREDLPAAAQIIMIQMHQLEGVLGEITQARDTLQTAFEGIATETRGLAVDLGKGRDESGSSRGSQAMDAFVEHCRQMGALQEESNAVGREARAGAATAVEDAARLTQHFRKLSAINFEMHLQALNAIVKTAALGRQGVTLEVLSSQVDRLFRESNDEVTVILQTVERFQFGHCAEPASEGARAQIVTGQDMQPVVRAFHDFSKTASEAEELAAQEERLLERSNASIEFLQRMASALEKHIDDMKGLLAGLPAAGGCGNERGHPAPACSERYTMQSEREVHARVTGESVSAAAANPPGAVPCAAVATAVAGGAADMIPGPSAPATVQATPSLTPGEQDEPKRGAMVLAGPEEPPLGDNVELF